MPVVRVENRQVDTAPLAGVRKTAAETALSTGAGLAEAEGQTAQAGVQLASQVARLATHQIAELEEKERRRADQVALANYETSLGKWVTKRTLDPKTGAFTIKGEAAMPLPEVVGGEFKTVAGAFEETLNPRQRRAAQAIKARYEQNLDMSLRRHVFGEMQTFEAQTLAATEENATEFAAANATDRRVVEEQLDRGIKAIKESGPRLGLVGPVLEKRLNDFTTKTYVDVIDRLVATKKIAAARIYFEEAKEAGTITGKALAHVEKSLAVATDREEAQQAFDKIVAEGGTPAEQRAKARELTGEVRDSVESRLDRERAINDRDERDAKEATSKRVYDILDKTADVTKIPAAVWSDMTGAERSSAQIYATKKAKGEPVETDQVIYYMLRESATTHPADFLKTNLLTFKHQLSDTDFQQLTDLRGAMRSGKQPPALDDFRSETGIINNALTLAGFDASPADSDTEGKKRIAQFHGLVAAEERRILADTGKKLSNPDREALANRILAKQITDEGMFWNTKKSLVEATPDDIPPAEKKAILARLVEKGHTATPEAALHVWLKAQAKKVGGQ